MIAVASRSARNVIGSAAAAIAAAPLAYGWPLPPADP